MNPNNPRYHDYGGRGITMFENWQNDFEAFKEYIGPRPSKKHSIDRIDNFIGYVPGNLRWVTCEVQNSNTRTNRYFNFRGEKIHLAALCRKYSINKETFLSRLETGWTLQDALLVPKLGVGKTRNGRRGVSNGRSKITKEKAIEIRSIAGMTQKEIGKKYGISQTSVWRIVSMKSW